MNVTIQVDPGEYERRCDEDPTLKSIAAAMVLQGQARIVRSAEIAQKMAALRKLRADCRAMDKQLRRAERRIEKLRERSRLAEAPMRKLITRQRAVRSYIHQQMVAEIATRIQKQFKEGRDEA